MDNAHSTTVERSVAFPQGEGTQGPNAQLELTLHVAHADVVAELKRIPAGVQREQFALAALRVGVIALRTVSGELDAVTIREAGNRLLGELRETFTKHATGLTNELKSALHAYFDPRTGLLQQRIESLVKKDGDMERLLLAHLGPGESVIARTLAERIGETSAIFKILSPTDKNGLLSSLETLISTALEEQREAITSEFSLDRDDSALSRIIERLVGKNGEFVSKLGERIDAAVGEFSLDDPRSALSRLVMNVEKAQTKIAAEFSTDNAGSAINRLSSLLDETSRKIDANLTLDMEGSALYRLRGQLMAAVEHIAERNERFQTEMRVALSELKARKEEADMSTRHGITYEERLGELLSTLAKRQGDVWEAIGNKTGVIQYNKTGDFVVELGPDSQAPGERIVWEAKENQSYSLKDALDEIDEARRNRSADIGVFVFSSKTAPAGIDPFARYGSDFVVIWDAEDGATDIIVNSTYSVTRALCTRKAVESQESAKALDEIDRALRAIERQTTYLGEFKTKGETIRNHGKRIAECSLSMAEELAAQISLLDNRVALLKVVRNPA